MLEEEGAMSFGTRDLLQIMGESWLKLEEMGHVEQPMRLLAQARAAGWLSRKGDPSTGFLIKSDDEDWMKGREDILPERSHRHPHCWWELNTGWVNEQGEPKKLDWKQCVNSVVAFPEQQPDEHVNLKCMRREAALHCIDLSTAEAGVTFTELWDPLLPQCFESLCAQRREEAKVSAMLKNKQLLEEKKKKLWGL